MAVLTHSAFCSAFTEPFAALCLGIAWLGCNCRIQSTPCYRRFFLRICEPIRLFRLPEIDFITTLLHSIVFSGYSSFLGLRIVLVLCSGSCLFVPSNAVRCLRLSHVWGSRLCWLTQHHFRNPITCLGKRARVCSRCMRHNNTPRGKQRPCHVENTGSRQITEVKQRRARLVLGWVTAWEHRVQLASSFLFF